MGLDIDLSRDRFARRGWIRGSGIRGGVVAGPVEVAVEKLLNGKNDTPLSRTAHAEPAKRNHKRSKLDEDGNRCRTVKADDEMNAPGALKNEPDADAAIASLSSPVTSLVYMGAASRMLPASVMHAGAGSLDLHEGVA
jgi:hypothetical protein